jgi:hypothetical protein
MASTATGTRQPAATAIAALALVGMVGASIMTVAHLGIDLGFIRAAALPPVAAGFAVGAVLFAAVAYGALRSTAWAWPLGLVVNGVGFVSAVFPWRGAEALLPAAVTLAAVVILLSRPGREALLYRR